MNSLWVSAQGAISQGLLWGIMVLGIYITYKVLQIADLTVDGSLALGGSLCAAAVAEWGLDPALGLALATAGGLLAGLVTGFFHTTLGIPPILAGILTQLGLWSVNLRVMGKSNIPLLKADTVFSRFADWTGMSMALASLCLGMLFVAAVVAFLYWFFGTELGSAMRAAGQNEDMIKALGCSSRRIKMIGLGLSNALVGLSGALVCQQQKYADVGMGLGAIVTGLAAIVIGDVLFSKAIGFLWKLTGAVVGCIMYFIIRALVLRLGLDAQDMKLFSALLVAGALCLPGMMARWRAAKA